jgi:hypothetical protein
VPVKDTMISIISPLERRAKKLPDIDENKNSFVSKLYHKELDKDVIQEKFSEYDDFYEYYYVDFNNSEYLSSDLDYFEYTIKDQYVSTSRTNSIYCALYNEQDNLVCRGKFDFAFNYQTAAKKIINAR